MPSLAETQSAFRDALVGAEDCTAILPFLVGGPDPRRRLAIHQRHYETSLLAALRMKFPATAWLTGSAFLQEAARAFIRHHPPTAPCVAEYGQSFPDFLGDYPGAERMPYLRFFTKLEWHLGQVAIAIGRPALALSDFAQVPTEQLPEVALELQSGIHYLHAPWPVDRLISIFLDEPTHPECPLAAEEVWLEVRGARGELRFNRLDPADFAFRTAILAGRSISIAAERALEIDRQIDIGLVFSRLVTDGHVVAIKPWPCEKAP